MYVYGFCLYLNQHFDASDVSLDARVVKGGVPVLTLLIHVESVVKEGLDALVLAVQHDQVEQRGAVIGLGVQDAAGVGLVLDEDGQNVCVAVLTGQVNGRTALTRGVVVCKVNYNAARSGPSFFRPPLPFHPCR